MTLNRVEAPSGSPNPAIGVAGELAVTAPAGGATATESLWSPDLLRGQVTAERADSPSVTRSCPYSETSFSSSSP